MTPRPPSCDGTECKPLPTGWWHAPDCLAWQATDDIGPEDMAASSAMEDGYYCRPTVAAQQRRAA
ncbi:hypothetical protein [Actinacidiphila sp. ITFR-21]|uniref:hypothetical protein n=1 Tax=Actinacidiphila sp. ITFR-21 TaxID=3075199 RepID=UPI002889BDAF|nr:hypothetical protein [Streptomyces sp. ITFR-21]WNI19124.1 hypothetical protein RLT57_28710 [Streptomyces sp. ITFR-21]